MLLTMAAGFLSGRGPGAAGDVESAHVGPVEKRGGAAECDGLDTRQGREALDGEALESVHLFRARIGAGRQGDAARDQLGGLPARAAVVEVVQAADEERGGGEQHHREGELADDEQLPEALLAAAAGLAARAGLEGVVQVEPQREQRGGEAEGDRGEQRRPEGPAHHGPVDLEPDELAVVAGGAERGPVAEAVGHEDGQGAAGQGKGAPPRPRAGAAAGDAWRRWRRARRTRARGSWSGRAAGWRGSSRR
jgi:hypothetical protein